MKAKIAKARVINLQPFFCNIGFHFVCPQRNSDAMKDQLDQVRKIHEHDLHNERHSFLEKISQLEDSVANLTNSNLSLKSERDTMQAFD